MKQIRKAYQNKKTLKCKHLHSCYPKLVNSLDKSWNSILPNLYLLQKKLRHLGVIYEDGQVKYLGQEDGDV